MSITSFIASMLFQLLIILLLFPCVASANQEWEVEMFNKAQMAYKNYDEREASLIIGLDFNTKEYYEIRLPLQNAIRKINRIAFMDKLHNDPDSIDWSLRWMFDGFDSSEQEKRFFERANTNERVVYDKYLSLKAELRSRKELFDLIDNAFEKNSEVLDELYVDHKKVLSDLQCEVDKIKLTNRYEDPQFRCFTPEVPSVTNYDYNTIFALSPYSDEKLLKLVHGSSREEVIQKIGKPLYSKQIKFLDAILFSKEKYRLEPMSATHHGVDASVVVDQSSPYLALWFDEEGNVNHVFNNGYIGDDEKEKLLGVNKPLVLSKYGVPSDRIHVNPCYFLSYSRIKEGPYTGDYRGIYVRRVYFDNGHKVIAVEAGQGPEPEVFSGIIKIE